MPPGGTLRLFGPNFQGRCPEGLLQKKAAPNEGAEVAYRPGGGPERWLEACSRLQERHKNDIENDRDAADDLNGRPHGRPPFRGLLLIVPCWRGPRSCGGGDSSTAPRLSGLGLVRHVEHDLDVFGCRIGGT